MEILSQAFLFWVIPDKWDEKTFIPLSTQTQGADFAKDNKYYVLKVPSAIISEEFIYLLNPNHQDHQNSKILEIIDPFNLDARFFNIAD